MDESVIDKLDMRSQKDSDECSEVDETEQKTRMPKGRPRKYPVKVGKYKCESCPVLCSKPSILEKHRRVHTDERPYPCPKCQIGFKTISNLNKHLKSKAHLLLEYRQRDETLCEQDAIKLENCRSIISALVDSKSFNSIDDLPNDLDIYSGVLLIQGSEADKKKQTSPTDLSKETTLQPRDFKLSFILYRKDFFEIVNRVKSQSVERDLIAPLEETMQEEKKDSDPTCLKAKDDSHMVKLTTSYESNGVKESRKRHKSGQSGVREQRNNSSVEEEQITRQVKMKIQHKLMRAKSDTYGIMNRPTGMDANNEKPYFGFSLSENDKGYIQETTLRKMEDGKLLDMTCWQGARITTASSGNSSSLSSETLNNESIETPGDKLPQINQQNKIIFEKFLENMKRGGKREGEQQNTEMVKHRLDTGEMVRGPPKKRKFDESSTPSDHQEGDSLTTDAINQQGLLFKALSYHDDNDFMKKMTNLNQSLLNNNNASLLMLAPYYNLLNSNGLFQTSDGQILRNNNNTPLVTIPDILNRKLTNSTQITTSVNSVPSPVAVGKGVDGKKFICCDRNFKSQGDLLKHQKSKPHCDKNGNFMISKRQNSSELNQKPSYYHPAQPPNVNANDFAQEMPINLICQSADQSSLRANFETILKNASNYQEMARQNPNEIVNSERNNSYYINETRTIKCEYCREDVKIRLYQTHILTHHVNGSIQRQTPTNSIEDDNSNEDSRTITPEYFSTGITSSRPHVCNVCGKGFRVEGHLMKHYRSKAHMTSAVQKYGYSSDLIDQVPKEQLSSGDLIDKKTGVLNLDAIERLRKIFNVNNSCNKQS